MDMEYENLKLSAIGINSMLQEYWDSVDKVLKSLYTYLRF